MQATGTADTPSGSGPAPPGPRRRDYHSQSLTDLESAHEHVDALIENHQALIPDSMTPLIRQWRDDLWTAIEAHAEKDAESEQSQA